MPDLNHRFRAGKMNKDLDERLVPNGEYRDAMNVQVSTSDGSDVGSLQNIMGNLDLSSAAINPNNLELDLYVVGSIVNEKTNKLYWMVSGVGVDFIAEYDYKTGSVEPIIVDVFPATTVTGNDTGRVLNFDKRFLITGINIIDDSIFWTDNNTEPKKINITRVRMGTVNFNTHTDFYIPDPNALSSNYVSVGPIRHEHITIAKKAPKTAPKLEMKTTTRGDLDYDGIVGETETTMTGADITSFWNAASNEFVTTPVTITFDTSPDFKQNDLLVIEAAHEQGQPLKQSIVVEIVGGISSNGVWSIPNTCSVQVVSWDLNLDITKTNFNVSLKQVDPLFEFKFPRFAYRYKFVDGEYSTFSPFSEVAFLAGKFDYLPKEGYNLGMVNNVRSLGVCDFVDERSIPDDVVSIDLLYKESNSPSIYTVKTIKRVLPNSTLGYDEWNAISVDEVNDPTVSPPRLTYGYVNIQSEMIHAMLPANQLLRSWDNIPRKALAQEVVKNRLVYGNYLQNYSMVNSTYQQPTALRYASNYGGQVTLPKSTDITTNLRLSITSKPLGDDLMEELDAGKIYTYRSAKTIKTLRSYQLGVVYIDEFGRETPVFSNSKSKNHTVYAPIENASFSSKLKAQVRSAKPDWAKHFKFLIKETSNEYYNLAMDRWYLAEDGNIWLSFPSSERNKVDLETFLILKKGHDTSEAITDSGKYKILDIDNEAPLFLKTKRTSRGDIIDTPSPNTPSSATPGQLIGGVSTTGGLHFPYPGRNTIEIDSATFLTLQEKIQDEGSSDWEFRVTSPGGASKWYGIKSMQEKTPGWTRLKATKNFGQEMGITTPWTVAPSSANPGYANLNIEFSKKEIVNKPEFDGRFFVKILKDAKLQKYIIGYSTGASVDYSVVSAIVSQYINPEADAVLDGTYQGGDNWFGQDEKLLSLSPHNDDSSPNASEDGVGDEYWKRAGQDKTYTSTTDGQSSGWFIDKVEAFRSFKYTQKFYGKDNSWWTNPYSGSMFNAVYQNYNDPNPNKQLQLIGTNTLSSTPNTYLGINNVKPPGNTLRNASVGAHGKIIPSIGIDPLHGNSGGGANLIHLSYAGAGDSQGNNNISSLSSLKTAFSDWAGDYVEEQAFIDSITTGGTIWRWKEDPGSVIYRTVAAKPGSFSAALNIPDITQAEWNASYQDYDGELGTELFNYTKLSDYGYAYIRDFVFPKVNGGYNSVGTTKHTAFVSQGKGNENFVASTAPFYTVGGVAALGVWTTLNILPSYYTTQIGVILGSHPRLQGENRWAMFTEDWSKPKNRRRRYSIHAEPLPNPKHVDEFGNLAPIDGTEGLGGIKPHYYLPTNPPDLEPHFAVDGTPLTSATTPALPATIAPGIRPDGMYTGLALQNNYTIEDVNGVAQTYTTIPSHRVSGSLSGATVFSPAPGSVTWEVLEPYIDDGTDEGYFSSNPAIWETEPKENVDLDIYHEVGQIYPTELNEETIEQFFGPIHDDLLRNSKVTCWMPGPGGGMIDLETSSGGTDIRLYAANVLNGEVFVIMQDTDGVSIDVGNGTSPPLGSRLIFTRADGSVTEISVKAVPTAGAFFSSLFNVETDTHNYEVTLPWFNAYSFGNGVESNRVRDDYNQVIIDKGPKVSTTLEEPYAEERRSSGLIYSGIYNSMSGVNELNQFIQAEKITKDLNPSYGSIQKLFARDTNLVTLCEDKVFKILAHKDALYNADGNTNLMASEKVLGQTIPFVGDYGISTNPESFAFDSHRAYFADKSRGSVLRLSQDGLTPVSSIGMTDWFSDNLTDASRILGNFDERKNEYNINLSYFDFSRLPVSIRGYSKGGTQPFTPSNALLVSHAVASKLQIGDTVVGAGIPVGATVIDKIAQGYSEFIIKISQPPSSSDVAPLGDAVPQALVVANSSANVEAYWSTTISIEREDDQNPITVSFSELNKGWVSFKSFNFEDGLSLNNEYFTFKKGQLFKHHASDNHNTFYDVFTESSVEVLFNESPGSVKSFQTLDYEGTQSKITADTENSGEYWDNKDKLGWYIDNMKTDLQEAEPSQFKGKEGKWFSSVQGVATEWLDDGTAGNIDTSEFSYQGIDDNDGVTVVSGEYTSWECQQIPQLAQCSPSNMLAVNFATLEDAVDYFFNNPDTLLNKSFNVGTAGNYTLNYFESAAGSVDTGGIYTNNNHNFIGNNDVQNGYDEILLNPINNSLGNTITTHAPGSQVQRTFHVDSTSINTILQWYIDNVDSTAFYLGMTRAQMASATGFTPGARFQYPSQEVLFSNPSVCSTYSGSHNCVEIPGLSGTYAKEADCLADTTTICGDPCLNPNVVQPQVEHATYSDLANVICDNGTGSVEVNMGVNTTSWAVEYLDSNTLAVVYSDPTAYTHNGWSDPAPLNQGSYKVKVTDNMGCETIVPLTIDCVFDCSSSTPHVVSTSVTNAIGSSNTNNCTKPNGAAAFSVQTLNNSAVSFTVEWFQVVNGISTSIYADATLHDTTTIPSITNLAAGDYEYVITDGLGCTQKEMFKVGCNTIAADSWNCSDGVCVDPGDGSGDYSNYNDCLGNCSQPPLYTWNCNLNGCVSVLGTSGSYATELDCINACVEPVSSYNCVSGQCIDPGDGSGTYSNYSDCISNCAPLVDCPVIVNEDYNWSVPSTFVLCADYYINWSVAIPGFPLGATWNWKMLDPNGTAIMTSASPIPYASGGSYISGGLITSNGYYTLVIDITLADGTVCTYNYTQLVDCKS